MSSKAAAGNLQESQLPLPPRVLHADQLDPFQRVKAPQASVLSLTDEVTETWALDDGPPGEVEGCIYSKRSGFSKSPLWKQMTKGPRGNTEAGGMRVPSGDAPKWHLGS